MSNKVSEALRRSEAYVPFELCLEIQIAEAMEVVMEAAQGHYVAWKHPYAINCKICRAYSYYQSLLQDSEVSNE